MINHVFSFKTLNSSEKLQTYTVLTNQIVQNKAREIDLWFFTKNFSLNNYF